LFACVERNLVFTHVLLPIDGSELSKRAVIKEIEFAKSVNARVARSFAIQDAAKKILRFVEASAKLERVPCATVYESEIKPYEGIIRIAEAHR
jgi:nucleotide-binding universal stress UspA family protein